MLIAAAIAMVAVGIVWQTFMRPETAVVRGGAAAPVQMQASDPAALKRQIVDELRAAGVRRPATRPWTFRASMPICRSR